MSVVKEKKMAAERSASGAFFQSLLSVGLYKRSQGRITRQVTFFSMVITIAFGAWRLNEATSVDNVTMHWVIPVLLVLCGTWLAYRLVNMAAFADFLIAVEAEMGKVSWPTQTELFRGSMVVLMMIAFLATVLYAFDYVWAIVFTRLIGILN